MVDVPGGADDHDSSPAVAATGRGTPARRRAGADRARGRRPQPTDHRQRQPAQGSLEVAQGASAQAPGLPRTQAGGAGQPRQRRAAADHAQGVDHGDLPASPSASPSAGARRSAWARISAAGRLSRRRVVSVRRGGPIAVQAEHRPRGRRGSLSTRRALERVLLIRPIASVAEISPAWGPPSNLSPLKVTMSAPSARASLHRRFLGQAPAGQVHQGAAEVFQQRQAVAHGRWPPVARWARWR